MYDTDVNCSYCRNCDDNYRKTLEALDIRFFKVALATGCSRCDKGANCPTYVLYLYLQENYPNGFAKRHLSELPPELRIGICHYMAEKNYIE